MRILNAWLAGQQQSSRRFELPYPMPAEAKKTFSPSAALPMARVAHLDKYQDERLAKAVEGLDVELPRGRLDQDFPYQVAFPTARCAPSRDALLIPMFCDHRNVTSRHHTVRRDDKDFIVYCFADPQHAESFQAAFGGEPFTLRSADAAPRAAK